MNEESWVRTHFVTGSIVHPSLVQDSIEDGFAPLEERTNVRNHFSYGIIESVNSDAVHTIDHFHDERRS